MTKRIPCPAVTPEPIKRGALGRAYRASCALNATDYAAIAAAAAADGRTVSSWLRQAALAALEIADD